MTYRAEPRGCPAPPRSHFAQGETGSGIAVAIDQSAGKRVPRAMSHRTVRRAVDYDWNCNARDYFVVDKRFTAAATRHGLFHPQYD